MLSDAANAMREVGDIAGPICVEFVRKLRLAGLTHEQAAHASANVALAMCHTHEDASLASAIGLKFIEAHLKLGGVGFPVHTPPAAEVAN